MSGLPPCDKEISEHGRVIAHFHARATTTEDWVKRVAAESGQRVDWHYSAGYAIVLFIGDYAKVRAAVERLLPDLREACSKTDWPLERFQIYES